MHRVSHTLFLLKLSDISQNLVQGRLVNGSIGRVKEFMTIQQANAARILIAKVDNGRGEVTNSVPIPRQLGPDGNIEWPVVVFENGDSCLCPPVPFTVVNVFGRIEASRDQVHVYFACPDFSSFLVW